jgi:N-acetylglucosaminyl-diphospho-decaprenol L-rhamnosyltransferase
MVRLGMVIVTYKCREMALSCLESIAAYLPEALADTVVVDNASEDGTAAAVRERFPVVRVLEKQRNVGFAAGVNAGIRVLPDADVICLLNPDSLLLDGKLAEAAAFLECNEDIGVAGGRIENIDGTLQPSSRAFPSHLNALFNRHSLLTKLAPENRWSRAYLMTDWSHGEVQDVDWVSGACMLIHRRAIERIGLLDAGYFFSIEDVDYCRRVHDAGLRVAYFPGARVRHRVGGSSRHAVYRAMTAHHRGMWRYYRTHMRGGPLLDAVTGAGIGVRLGIHAVSYTVRTGFNRLRGAPNP